MDRLHPLDTGFDQLRAAGIFLSRNPRYSQQHLGIIYRDEADDACYRLHLAWHHRLERDDPAVNESDLICFWADPLIPQPRLELVAARCLQLFRANPKGIPYGFSRPVDCFDQQTSEFLMGSTSYGLTCSSFVLAVFHLAGWPLARLEQWPRGRSGDEEWQSRIISFLEQPPGASPEHLQKIRSDIGAVRYRPEEVAAASLCENSPASFEDAEKMSQLIRLELGYVD